VFLVDIDDDEAKGILAVDNRTARLASFDEHKLVELLSSLARTPRGLTGTGYDGDDLDDLIQQLTPPNLGDLGGGGGGGSDDSDLWPVLKFKVPPDVRDKFYALTDDDETGTDDARFVYLVRLADGHSPAGEK
jgi:hypothetical protein